MRKNRYVEYTYPPFRPSPRRNRWVRPRFVARLIAWLRGAA